MKKFIPALKDMPSQYIYEPWKAPIAVQKKANCILGKDYPHRVFDHEFHQKLALEQIRLAFEARRTNVVYDESKLAQLNHDYLKQVEGDSKKRKHEE